MEDKIHLCTLFDSNYLDKGLVLYDSLIQVCNKFILYIFAFDQTAYEILLDLKLANVEVIALEQLETDELLRVKEKRTKGEYCWTCTPAVIKYVLDHYNADICTYIDSDLFFYRSPQILLEEFYRSKKSVGLVRHRFPNTCHGKKMEKEVGKYCVQFNTFKDNEESRKLLEIWQLQCLEKCDLETIGDQLYISDWGEKYEQVYEYGHIGGGAAPWNLADYKVKKMDQDLYLIYKGRRYEMIFYHFQGIQYSDDGKVNINVIAVPDGGLIKNKTIQMIYYPYLNRIEAVRNWLEEHYNLSAYRDGCGRKFEPTKFHLTKFLKSFFRRIKEESLWSAIDLTIRVFRKGRDIICLNDIKSAGL